ncbi:dipeptidase [Lentiprolixibacter aurantiacus]|uniref:Membrane dipeptidase n=1 Tax=Lentiprolixibacter aurantiacus TaxID=2993939 RepID=A0AAE3MIS1_9FLAO|nr:membrane dipeptidase [Lentiprolixibacter aurantiacus]
MFVFDAHLDLAMNAMEWNRDLRLPVRAIREREAHLKDKPDRGKNTVSFPAMRAGNIGLCMATQIARYVKENNPLPGWHSPEQAWAQTQGQLSWYRAMESAGELVQIRSLDQLEKHLELWSVPPGDKRPIGYILTLEGADSIVNLDYLQQAHQQGLRAIGPAHYGPGTYAQGTNASGGIGEKGKALLREMENLNIILDVTHLCDQSFWEALDHFNGPVWASHNNCRSLVPHNRQFSDDQIRALIEREAVIGIALDTWMLVPGWEKGISLPKEMGANLNSAVEHMDHICQLAGNAMHVGIGTDLDGGFGKEQSPADLDTIADLQKFIPLLNQRGYSETEIENFMHGNFLRFLRKAWQK